MFKIDISPVPKVGRLVCSSGENPQQRDKVLPVVARAAEGTDSAFYRDDLAQERVVNGAVNAKSIAESQAKVQGESLE